MERQYSLILLLLQLSLCRLPQYLLIHVRRFTSNVHVDEKNPTIVTFPLRGLDLAPYVDPRPLSTVYDLLGNVPLESTIASTTSSGTGPGITKKSMKTDDETRWKVHLRAGKGGGESERWYALHDLETSEVRREMVFLGETVLQVSFEICDLFVRLETFSADTITVACRFGKDASRLHNRCMWDGMLVR